MLRRAGLLIFCLWPVLLFCLTGCKSLPTGQTGELPYLRESPGIASDSSRSQSSPEQGQALKQNEGAGPAGKTTTVVLYFADKNGSLVAFPKQIPKVAGIARRTVEELCQGPPADSELFPTIPPGARLKDINIKNGLATVDFNQNLKSRHWGGSTGELLTVYSIVNTLTQFPSVEKVQILIEGERVQTLAGHLDISRPLAREGNLIKTRARE